MGGQDAPITLVGREEGSGTRSGFEDLVMNKVAVSGKMLVSNSTGAVKTTVAGDRDAIGYISMAALDSTVKDLAVEGVKCNSADILSGKYKLSRPFVYITKGEPKPLAKAFLDFVMSPQGQSILAKEGAVPVK